MKRAQSGMTLVEVVVAATIFAAIMLATTTAFRTFARSYNTLSVETAKTSRIREVDRFLRGSLRDAVALEGQFEGSATEVRWVAPIDRVGSAGGLQHLRLSRISGKLALSFAPLDYSAPLKSEPRWGAFVDTYTLLEGITDLSLSYRPLASDTWGVSPQPADSRSGHASLPAMVRLQIVTSDGEWPPIIVSLDQHEALQ